MDICISTTQPAALPSTQVFIDYHFTDYSVVGNPVLGSLSAARISAIAIVFGGGGEERRATISNCLSHPLYTRGSTDATLTFVADEQNYYGERTANAHQ